MKKIMALIISITFIFLSSSCSSDNKKTENETIIKVYFSNAMSDGTYTIDNLNESFFMDLIDNYNENLKKLK